MAWKESGKLFAQLVRHISSAAPDTGIASRVRIRHSRGRAEIEIVPGEPLDAIDARTRLPLPLRRGPDGGERLDLAVGRPGAMRPVLLQKKDGTSLVVGAVSPPDPELLPSDEGLFDGAAPPLSWRELENKLSGGRMSAEQRMDLSPWLILAVLLLLPIDVGLRRYEA